MAKKKVANRGKNMASKRAAAVDNTSSDVKSAACSAATATPPIIPVFLKVCRLCESKDGPFLNIFDSEKLTAKKIDDLMPFSITENDDLPHKICFRCSAKLEELYEFVQKCINTQESLRTAVGKTGPFLSKTKMSKKLWEEKLNKSNMSNDDICDALIKKAMAGIKGLPVQPEMDKKEAALEPKRGMRSKESVSAKLQAIKTEPNPEDDEVTLKQVKQSLENSDKKVPVVTRSSKQEAAEIEKPDISQAPSETHIQPETKETKKASVKSKKSNAQHTKIKEAPKSNLQNDNLAPSKTNINNLTFDYDAPSTPVSVKESDSEEEKKEPKKPFNIMDHISMIKVNGVGILFQCKLCNRNFLRKDVVESHSCAKNGVPKFDAPKSVPVVEPPKLVPSVKYIKIDNDMKKSLTEKVKLSEQSENQKKLDLETNTEQEKKKTPPKLKPRPKIGPASKIKRNVIDLESDSSSSPAESMNTTPPQQPPNTNPPMFPTAMNPNMYQAIPSVHFPSLPNLNGRFKLVPGPNNMFSLVEDSTAAMHSQMPHIQMPTMQFPPVSVQYAPVQYPVQVPPAQMPPVQIPPVPPVQAPPVQVPPVQAPPVKKASRKRKMLLTTNETEVKPKQQEVVREKSESPEIIEVETKPYPVGLFQTVGHSQPGPAPFTTPAMKKQSYTIVQTGNPSKLLISTKKAVEEEAPKKRQRKSKNETKDYSSSKEPFTVTLEDVAHPKDTGFFTFINVDPLLQPSYVLPTDNIIQESQISTSSSVLQQPTESKHSKDNSKYSCNMCGDTFSREKKLMAHIQNHYKMMDEEDNKREEKNTKKKGKK